MRGLFKIRQIGRGATTSSQGFTFAKSASYLPSYFHKAWQHLRQLLLVYLLGIACFTFFRLLLLLTNLHMVEDIAQNSSALILRAFVMGWRFDTVISCYLLAPPCLLLSIFFIFQEIHRHLLTAIYIFIAIFFPIAILACAADIPFFNHFFARLNDLVFNWTANAGFGFKMILQEPSFLVFVFVFVAVVLIYLFLLRKTYRGHLRIIKEKQTKEQFPKRLKILPFILVFWGLLFLGIRGRLDKKSPIHPGVAAFSNHPFINQLGLNPVFTLLRSYFDSLNPKNKIFKKLDDSVALPIMADLLHADPALQNISPIARYQLSDAPMQGRNIVLVMMESMSAEKMGRFGNPYKLTPFLDSLAEKSWSFDNIYSAGIHTYNGVYSTLFGHPAIMKRHTMETLRIPEMSGFPNVLGRHGYQQIFFTTHDEVFDNMAGFLTANGFESIVGQKDYPAKEVKSTLGVPDEFMFRFSIPRLNKLANKHAPFFAAFMTASDHDPIIIPEDGGFKRQHKDDKKAIVSYADWSIRQFMSYAATQSWYQNTVFVFVADHGAMMKKPTYDIAFSYHHIPFLIYAPGITSGRAFPQIGLQTDVFATVTSLVLPKYINNTFGIDLLHQTRPFSIFSADDKLACINDSMLYIWRTQTDPGLYHYKNIDPRNQILRYPQLSDSMRKIAFSWLQTSEWMLQEGKTGLPESK